MANRRDEASEALKEALSQSNALHLPGARALHRQRLLRVLALTEATLALADLDASTLASVRLTRVLAHAALANDARHGAGQLSRSANRAPSTEDCELGWNKVEAIVARAEASAADAKRLAALIEDVRANEAALAATTAAQDARQIVDRRNNAYTFHTDPGFSFGEGWYVAAAGVLAKVEIQIETGLPQSASAKRFLQDAGLCSQLVPYRSRPRANKALPAIIARAFSEDPTGAQSRLRTSFLGPEPIKEVVDWTDAALRQAPRDKPKVLVWVRHAAHDASRNSVGSELAELCQLAAERGLVPVLFGDAMEGTAPFAVDLTLCWKEPLFQSAQTRRAQLQLFDHLVQTHGLAGQIGVTTAGMDGPALMGLPTMYVTDKPNSRLGQWVGCVPGYEEILRTAGYVQRIGTTFSRWAQNGS